MCGIVGAVAQRNIVSVLVEGLRRLEYRGYDSCGVAVLSNGEPRRARSVARVSDLDAQVRDSHLGGMTGIAHTPCHHHEQRKGTLKPFHRCELQRLDATA